MKKYFGYIKSARAVCTKPSMIEFEGKTMTSFCNSYSLALTKEPCGGIALFTDDDGNYPDTGKIVRREGIPNKVDFHKAFAKAKAEGYKLKKSEVDGHKYKYLFKYGKSYFKVGLVQITYAIIDDGKEATVYNSRVACTLMTIENDIGVCTIMPMNVTEEFIKENDIIVIEME